MEKTISYFFFYRAELINARPSLSEKYADRFGFTEEDVFAALKEYGLRNKKEQVKEWKPNGYLHPLVYYQSAGQRFRTYDKL